MFSIHSQEHSCKDFRCKEKDFCINPDLLCDRINHCEDGSDEEFGKLCEGERFFSKYFNHFSMSFTPQHQLMTQF